jgi:hypothetical protein
VDLEQQYQIQTQHNGMLINTIPFIFNEHMSMWKSVFLELYQMDAAYLMTGVWEHRLQGFLQQSKFLFKNMNHNNGYVCEMLTRMQLGLNFRPVHVTS